MKLKLPIRIIANCYVVKCIRKSTHSKYKLPTPLNTPIHNKEIL